jgi:hypothetical protein
MKGLFDFLQSASNTAADTVAGPVDLISGLMGLAGLPIKEPVGGSEWMKRWGLKRDVEMGGARLAGETAGLLSPALLAAKAPQIAKGLLAAQENAAIPRQMHPEMGAIVYHGSPHKFDKFDSSKIGTGEGAQAYGHGLYLADDPKVATAYQEALSGNKTYSIAGEDLGTPMSSAKANAVRLYLQHNRDPEAAIKEVNKLGTKSGLYPYNGKRYREDISETIRALPFVESQGNKITENVPGALYKVDLPDEAIAKMLDWDKPLSQQAPEVQKALAKLGYRYDAQAMGAFDDALAAALEGGPATLPKQPMNPMGSDIARGSGLFDGPAQIAKAKALREAGIPGIRYLDGGSRGAGTGTSNYVVFPGEEGLLKILERNGGLMGP